MSFRIERMDLVDSTQRVVAERARAGASAGLVVVAREQSAGRGRQGRVWLSGPHGLWLSILRRPDAPAHWSVAWSGVLALAARDAIRLVTQGRIQPWLKWPNDVYVGERKLAGLLAEASLQGDTIESLVLGLGLNLRPPADGWPEGLASRATSGEEEGEEIDETEFIDVLTDSLLRWEGILKRTGPAQLVPSLRAASRPLFGRSVQVDRGRGPEAFLAIDLAQDGALLVRDADGRAQALYAADVHLQPLENPPCSS